MIQPNVQKPFQSEFQKGMLQVHAAILYCANAVASPIRNLFDFNTRFFVEPKRSSLQSVK